MVYVCFIYKTNCKQPESIVFTQVLTDFIVEKLFCKIKFSFTGLIIQSYQLPIAINTKVNRIESKVYITTSAFLFLFDLHHVSCFNHPSCLSALYPHNANLNKKTRLYGNRVQSEKANRFSQIRRGRSLIFITYANFMLSVKRVRWKKPTAARVGFMIYKRHLTH